MAHRAVATVLAVAALFVLPLRPLASLILFSAALAVVMNRRSAFDVGRYRTILAFISSLWLIVLGVVATLLGLIPAPGPCEAEPCEGNPLLLPGLLLLGAGLILLAWSVVVSLRARRSRRQPRA